jgi:hypothetical protein
MVYCIHRKLYGRNSCQLLQGSWELPFALEPTVEEQGAFEMLLRCVR